MKKKGWVPFAVADPTGIAIVDLSGDSRALDAFELMIKFKVVAATVSLGVAEHPGLAELDVRRANPIYEGHLAPGQLVAIFAQLRREVVDAGDGRGPQLVIRLVRPQGKRLLITDQSKWLAPPSASRAA